MPIPLSSQCRQSGRTEAFPHRAQLALVADDSAVNRKIAGIHLRRLGFQVENAVDSREALEKCLGTEFDLIIMDVFMPGMNGLDCTHLIRSQHLQGDNTLILGWSTRASRQECVVSGMDGVLPKPLNISSLQTALSPAARAKDASSASADRKVV